MQQWLLDNGIQAATLIAVLAMLIKGSRWTGIIETKIINLEGWLRSHIDHHPGKTGE